MCQKNGKWGFINRNGTVVIDLIYGDAYNFNEALAGVEKDGKWGFLDREGNVIIDFIYDFAYNIFEGLAKVKKECKWGYIDRDGNVVIDLIYDEANYFLEGRAGVKKNKKWGFIDRDGNVVIDLIYDYVACYRKGIAEATLNGETFYIDKQGNRIEETTQDYETNASGGMKDTKDKVQFTKLPLDLLDHVLDVMKYGAEKYDWDNWRKVEAEKYIDAFYRHYRELEKGEWLDDESGLPHVGHIATDILFYCAIKMQEREKK